MWTLNFHCILPLHAPPVTLLLTPFNYIKLHLNQNNTVVWGQGQDDAWTAQWGYWVGVVMHYFTSL